MAYSGFLIKIGDYTIPTYPYIKHSTYKATLSVLDVDSYRDANGELHRNALEHKLNKVEFETPYLTNELMSEFMSHISENYTIPKERKAIATIFVPEINDYMTQEVYMSDPSFEIYNADENEILYKPTRFAFIAY